MTNIERLFEGNLDMQRRCGTDPELREVEGYMEKHRNTLEKTLAGNDRETFSKYCSCADEALFLYGRDCFTQGFSTAARLMAEALLETR